MADLAESAQQSFCQNERLSEVLHRLGLFVFESVSTLAKNISWRRQAPS